MFSIPAAVVENTLTYMHMVFSHFGGIRMFSAEKLHAGLTIYIQRNSM